MRIWLFNLYDKAVVNEKAKHGLPNDVGKKVEIVEQLHIGTYDYLVKDERNTYFKVREIELDKIGDVI